MTVAREEKETVEHSKWEERCGCKRKKRSQPSISVPFSLSLLSFSPPKEGEERGGRRLKFVCVVVGSSEPSERAKANESGKQRKGISNRKNEERDEPKGGKKRKMDKRRGRGWETPPEKACSRKGAQRRR